MDNADTLRLLRHMREMHVSARREALGKRDMAALRQNQADVEMIDRAIEDEVRLQKEWVEAETARLARSKPQKDDTGWVPIEPPVDPMLL